MDHRHRSAPLGARHVRTLLRGAACLSVLLLAGAALGACAPPGNEIGDGCLRAEHCRSRLCVAQSGGSICSEACDTDCDCPTGFDCVAAGGAARVCVPGRNACGECEPTCDDGSACTTDRCNADLSCSFEPVPDRFTGCSSDVTATACASGASVTVHCPEFCLDTGSDGFRSCGSGSCRCVTTPRACTVGATQCGVLDGLTHVGICRSAAEAGTSFNVWEFVTCLDVCRDRGGSWTGRCEADPASGRELCFCTV
jgi:hypothetical protein